MCIDGVFITLESSRFGGGHEAISQTLKGYQERGLDVRAICPYVPGVEEYFPNAIPIKLKTMPYNQNPMENAGELCDKAVPIIRKLKPDVIFTHTYHAFPLLDKFPGTNRVYRVFGLKKRMLEVSQKNGFVLPYNEDQIEDMIKMESSAIQNCDKIRTTSATAMELKPDSGPNPLSINQ